MLKPHPLPAAGRLVPFLKGEGWRVRLIQKRARLFMTDRKEVMPAVNDFPVDSRHEVPEVK